MIAIEQPDLASSLELTSDVAVSRRILIADDDHDSAESLALLLQMEGHDVMIANDGETALRLFQERKPHFGLLDIGMPQMSGYELARRIRAQEGGAKVRLIAVTGWGQDKDREASLSAGFDHHLTKPCELADLLALFTTAEAA